MPLVGFLGDGAGISDQKFSDDKSKALVGVCQAVASYGIEEAIAHVHRVTEVNRIAKNELRTKIKEAVSKVTGVDHDALREGRWYCNFSLTMKCWYDIHTDSMWDSCLS